MFLLTSVICKNEYRHGPVWWHKDMTIYLDSEEFMPWIIYMLHMD